METSVLTSKGQVLIPKRIRTKYGIEAGGKIAFVETEEGVLLKPMNEEYIDKIVDQTGSFFPDAKEYKQWKKEEQDLENRFLNETVTSYKKRKANPKTKLQFLF